jgi:hypothetical protein
MCVQCPAGKARNAPAWINADTQAAGYYSVVYGGSRRDRQADITRVTIAQQVSRAYPARSGGEYS